MGKSCFFIGSHDAPERIKELLEGSVELHIIDDGVTDFYVGQYGNFDKMAARTVIAAKEEHPHIRLFLVNPYPFGKKHELPKGFDSFFYPEGLEQVPKRNDIGGQSLRVCPTLILSGDFPVEDV